MIGLECQQFTIREICFIHPVAFLEVLESQILKIEVDNNRPKNQCGTDKPFPSETVRHSQKTNLGDSYQKLEGDK